MNQSSIDRLARYAPLPRQEQIGLAILAKAGDNAAAKRLVDTNMRLVIRIASLYYKRHAPSGYYTGSLDDLVHVGAIATMMAMRSYDPGRNAGFMSYAVWFIRRDLIDFIRADQIIHPKEAKTYPQYVYNDNDENPFEFIKEDFDPQIDVRLDTNKALSILTPKERNVIQNLYGLGGRVPKSFNEMSAKNQSRTPQITIANHAIAKMALHLGTVKLDVPSRSRVGGNPRTHQSLIMQLGHKLRTAGTTKRKIVNNLTSSSDSGNENILEPGDA